MIGPREMGGAGTPSPRPLSRTRSSANPHYMLHGTGNAPRTPAQQLIDQYERLNTPPPCSPNRTKSTYRRQYISDPKALQSYIPQRKSDFMDREGGKKHRVSHHLLKKEGRSPIRQSLRNLLSVIKKGAEGIGGKRKSEDKLGVPYDTLGPAVTDRNKDGQEAAGAQKGTNQNAAMASATSTSHLVPHSKKRMTGPLLYLTRGAQLLPPDIPGPLIWTICSVTIDGNKLVVTSIVGDMDSTIHEISLSRCTDIRSLGTMQLSVEEADLLDRLSEGENMRVFEVLFEGRQRERFAAKSVRERAGWISAIWDAILPIHNANAPEESTSLAVAPEESNNHRNLPVESPRPKPLPQLSPLLTASRSERSLPPLPPSSLMPPPKPHALSENRQNVPNLHLDLSDLQGPISPSIYPPTSHVPSPATTGSLISPISYPTAYTSGSYFVASPTSMTTTPTSSCPPSPSIVNLGHLSVVRQRLAQIERNHSHLSAQSHSTNRSTPLPSPASSSGWSKREAVFYNNGPKTPSKLRPTSPAEDTPVIFPRSPDKKTNKQMEVVDVLQDVSPLPESKPGATKEDIRKLSKGLADIKGVIGGESGHPTVHQMVLALEHHARREKKALRNIQDSLAVLGERVTDVSVSRGESREDAQIDASVVHDNNAKLTDALKEVKDRLAVEFPALANKLEEVRKAQEKTGLAATSKLENVSSSANDSKAAPIDLKPVLDKLEEIRALCNFSKETRPTAETSQVEKILSLVQEDSNKQTLLSQQQADSVRYLNELNSWLEAFVNNGTSQIQGISTNLDRLCRELGFSELNDVQSLPGPQPSLVNDIRQLVAGMKARDQNFASLQVAVHSLLEVLTTSQTQKGADSQAIAGLMNQQRHDQEVLFRAFTNEISGEIKGERLRFVEAMKEATAINVQLHVEQFKQELGREVMAMTEEVGRLHREKLNVENQISDLFSFYSKHKQGDKPLQTIQENAVLPTPRQVPEKARSNLPRSHHHRLLPYPRHL